VASRRVVLALGLVALTLAVFHEAPRHAFVNLDDGIYVVRNMNLDAGLTRERVLGYFTQPFLANWAPLTLLSYHVDHALFGKQPGGYLATNLALHALAALLLFAALVRMTGRELPSAFVAAVFAIHPLHVETVAWVSERKGVLAGLFWMAGLAAHARYAARPGAGRYAVVLGCLALGLLAKPVLVTFPFALLLLDAWPLRRLSRRALVEKVPMLALVAAACALTLWAQREGGAMRFADARELPLALRLGNAADALVHYLRESVWPAGLTVFHPHPLASLSRMRLLGEAGLLGALTLLALRAWRSRPWLAVGWLWFVGTLVPTLGLVQVGSLARADRYTYVPLVGLALAVGWSGAERASRSRRARAAVTACGACAVTALALAAFFQVRHWQSSESLYARNLAIEPESYFAHSGLGLVRVEQGRLAEAEQHFREAFRVRPEYGRGELLRFHLLVGSRAAEAGDDAAAIARYELAVALDPADAQANGVLGAALVRSGRLARARPYLERAVANAQAPAVAHAALAVALAADWRMPEAVAAGREALRRDPGLAWAANNLAWILASSPDPALRDPREAVRLAEAAARGAAATSADVLDTLAAAYAADGRFEPARAAAERALARAEADGSPALAAAIRERLALYREQRAYFEPASAEPAPGASGAPGAK
jgi:tetratricopeptide (TPR) repeat protein